VKESAAVILHGEFASLLPLAEDVEQVAHESSQKHPISTDRERRAAFADLNEQIVHAERKRRSVSAAKDRSDVRSSLDQRPASAGLDRRDFLRLGLLAGPAVLLGASGCRERGMAKPLLSVARVNDWVSERLLSTHRLARQYPEAERSRDFPAYHISRAMPVLTDPTTWSLEVGGLVRNPSRFTLPMLKALPSVRYTIKHHCVEGWTAIGTWTGVPFSTIAGFVQPTPQARYLQFDSFDRGYFNGWDLKSAMHPQTILAYAFNDRDLMPDHGAPLRLYSPVKLGYKLTKYLTRVTFTDTRPGGYWEDLGYPWFGGV
jgi:DMSO/TMAO reductase YedYZ molybdopterin-dependent catalytic subunit